MTRRLVAIGCGGLALGALGMWLTRPAAPPFDAVRAAHGPSDARLLDRHGVVLDARRVDGTRRRLDWVPLEAIAPALRRAVVAVEDRRFAEHGGVDLLAVAAALGQAVRGGPSRGASTISMQLAALLDPRLRPRGGARSLAQKWGQARLARALERSWSKDEILEGYLNLVGFRGELEGVGAAAAALFGTTPGALTGAEGAVLAALVGAPGAPPAAVLRRAEALRPRLPDAPPVDAVEAAARRALSGVPAMPSPPSLAPHVAQRLLGTSPVVRTTLDAGLQRAAAAALERNLLAVRERGVQDGAVIAVDNDTGDVLAYVGSSGRLSGARHVDGVRARRQPGSALKPFLYALAIERRLLTPASLLEDAPLEIALPSGLYRPHDYEDRFLGLVSVRTALASSLNTPPSARSVWSVATPSSPSSAASASPGSTVPLTTMDPRSRSAARTSACGRSRARTVPLPTAAGGHRSGSGSTIARGLRGKRSSRQRPSWWPTSSPTARAAAPPSASRTRSPRVSGAPSRPVRAPTCATTGAWDSRAGSRSACGWGTSRVRQCAT